MNRRDFTRGLLSLGAVPALPMSGVLAGSASASATNATASHMYFMGWYTARLNKSCSADMLAAKLNVDADVAHEIFGKLICNKAIAAPDALGVSKVLDPLSRRVRPVSTRIARADPKTPLKRAQEHVKKVFQAEDGAPDDIADEGQAADAPDDVADLRLDEGGETAELSHAPAHQDVRVSADRAPS